MEKMGGNTYFRERKKNKVYELEKLTGFEQLKYLKFKALAPNVLLLKHIII